MVLSVGDVVHVVVLRSFEADVRRHFVGCAKAIDGGLARVEGFAFVYDTGLGQWIRRPERRSRLLALGDARNLVNVLPREADLDKVQYRAGADNHLVATDGTNFTLDINEFGARL